MNPVIKDMRGQYWTVGDRVVYPRAVSSSAYLQEGEVTEIKTVEVERYRFDPHTQRSHKVKEIDYKVKIRRIEWDGGVWHYGSNVTISNWPDIIKVDAPTNP